VRMQLAAALARLLLQPHEPQANPAPQQRRRCVWEGLVGAADVAGMLNAQVTVLQPLLEKHALRIGFGECLVRCRERTTIPASERRVDPATTAGQDEGATPQ
jgi:hypothetical protein